MDRIVAHTLRPAMRAWRGLKQIDPVKRFLYSVANEEEFGRILQHEVMLADRDRVDSYARAFERFIGPADTVVDLGTGTGILAMLAAQRGPRRVHAIDQSPIIDLAEVVARRNRLDRIAFHRMHSRDFTPPEPVSVIAHEQIGDHLIDEDMIRNVCDLRDRVLARGGRILPARFLAFLEPVELREGVGVPQLWDQRIHGLDFSAARDWVASRPEIAPEPSMPLYPDEVAGFLTDPAPAFAVDLETMRPDATPGTIHMSKTVVRDGVMAGFCMYFRICFDDDIWIDNSPFTEVRRDFRHHWLSMLFRADPTTLHRGDRIDIEWRIENPTGVADWKLDWTVVRPS